MRKILTSSQAQKLDALTMAAQGVSSYELMERAVCELYVHLKSFCGNVAGKSFVVVSGTGNNGGDGLGLARKLKEDKADVSVCMCDFSTNISSECLINLNKVKGMGIRVVSAKDGLENCFPSDSNAIVVDAIFGTGLNRSVAGAYAKVIDAMNAFSGRIVSIDIPSGLFADDNSGNDGAIVRADLTLSIQDYHLSAMFAENSVYYGDVCIVDIGHDQESLSSLQAEFCYMERSDVVSMIKSRRDFDHKGTFGHALLVAGGIGKAGAAVMCSRACMRTGVGLLTVRVPAGISDIMQISVPEAMLDIDDANGLCGSVIDVDKYTSVGIGPGIGTDDYAIAAVDSLLSSGKPMVMDADALNVLAADKEKLTGLKNCILTPHPKEFERLFGKMPSTLSRLRFMSEFSRSHNSVVILKGGVTSISLTTGKVVMYNGRNPGIATGGSGDVLAGVVASLLAQGYTVDEAAVMGVWLHGEAGKLAARRFGLMSTLATDIIDCLPDVCKSLERKPFGNL